jgi:hypothetical protein
MSASGFTTPAAYAAKGTLARGGAHAATGYEPFSGPPRPSG